MLNIQLINLKFMSKIISGKVQTQSDIDFKINYKKVQSATAYLQHSGMLLMPVEACCGPMIQSQKKK